jgi:hypothetical protein
MSASNVKFRRKPTASWQTPEEATLAGEQAKEEVVNVVRRLAAADQIASARHPPFAKCAIRL